MIESQIDELEKTLIGISKLVHDLENRLVTVSTSQQQVFAGNAEGLKLKPSVEETEEISSIRLRLRNLTSQADSTANLIDYIINRLEV